MAMCANSAFVGDSLRKKPSVKVSYVPNTIRAASLPVIQPSMPEGGAIQIPRGGYDRRSWLVGLLWLRLGQESKLKLLTWHRQKYIPHMSLPLFPAVLASHIRIRPATGPKRQAIA